VTLGIAVLLVLLGFASSYVVRPRAKVEVASIETRLTQLLIPCGTLLG
jgi:hypothetical protein